MCLACHPGMIVGFAAPAVIIAALVVLALLIFALVDPELTEVYVGEVQILVATAALAAIVLVA